MAKQADEMQLERRLKREIKCPQDANKHISKIAKRDGRNAVRVQRGRHDGWEIDGIFVPIGNHREDYKVGTQFSIVKSLIKLGIFAIPIGLIIYYFL